jgi:hypothetical protein
MGGRFGVLFGLLAVGLLIKKLDSVRVVGVRGAPQPGRGVIFAHGLRRFMCKFRIDGFVACNPPQLHQDRVRHFVEVSPNHDIYISIPGCGRADHAEAPPRNEGSASLQGLVQ